ncbi:c-type cytochrome [Mesobacillus zeae]|uniref:Cytochrome c n=1 Tax=Mesobacillus zeae TaxID=1917180 RepID=A0A398B211_9BACI|nr:c-type cytochrome [Mesobacillus zeae]RID83887.1 cytochrome c [Mesobacillus zeae]
MKKLAIVFTALAIIGLTVWLSPAPDFTSKEEKAVIENGNQLYNKLCLACHGENGEGEGKLAGTALNNQYFLSTVTNHDLENYIKTGRKEAKMPEYESVLEDKQVHDLVSFIRSWQTKTLELEAPSSIDGDRVNGKRMYNLYCMSCHGETGSGMEGMGTALSHPSYLKYTADRQIWLATAYGRENTRMGPSLKGGDGVRQLSKQEISDIVSYLRGDLSGQYNPAAYSHIQKGGIQQLADNKKGHSH